MKSKGNSAVLTPTGVGYYDLKCVVTDAEGVVAQKVFQVFVDGVLPLENVSEINKDETVPVGSTITISGKAKGGKSPVTYEYFFKRSENTKWNTLKTDLTTLHTQRRTYSEQQLNAQTALAEQYDDNGQLLRDAIMLQKQETEKP